MIDIAVSVACFGVAVYLIAKARKLWHEATEIALRNAVNKKKKRRAEQISDSFYP